MSHNHDESVNDPFDRIEAETRTGGVTLTADATARPGAPQTEFAPQSHDADLVQETGAVERTFERKAGLKSLLPSRSTKLTIGLAMLGVFVAYAIIAPFLVGDPNAISTFRLSGPGQNGFLLGSNQAGQDIWAQIAYGTRGSLIIGVIVGLLATILSTLFGVFGTYVGGFADNAFSLFTNVMLVIPGLPLVIIISNYIPADHRNVFLIALVLTITSWAGSARVLRSVTLSVRGRDYVMASKISGEKTWRILVVEILPNLIPVMASQLIFAIIFAILGEAGLSFLGLGPGTEFTLGKILQQANQALALTQGAWWWFIPPGLMIALIGMSLSLINFSVDEIINPKLRSNSRAARKRWGLTPAQIKSLEEENLR
ncbi:MAG: ABC transporter permease [Propionibacteriaceae bacterium]|jgi:peptide/nickel transport system permease protein|nr:ABC transporter permease [Propionibacteriaceae bacterium]